MAKIRSTKKVGLLKWESIVEEPTCIYYYYGWTKRSAKAQANRHLKLENKT